MELIEYLEKLEVHENKKEWEELLRVSEEAVKNFPYSQTLKIYRIKALIEKERLNEAKLLCEDLIRVNPGSFIIHSLLAKIHEKKGNYKKAIDEYNKILFLNPGDENSEKEIERLKKLLEEGEIEESSDQELDKTEPEIDLGERVESEENIYIGEKEEEIEFNVEEENFLKDGEEDKEIREEEVVVEEREKILEDIKDEIKVANEEEEKLDEGYENEIGENQVNLETETLQEETKEEDELKSDSLEDQGGDLKENQGEEQEENFDEDLYSTVSMAKILEDQEKYKEAQKIFLKIYKNDFSETAKKDIKEMGLNFIKNTSRAWKGG